MNQQPKGHRLVVDMSINTAVPNARKSDNKPESSLQRTITHNYDDEG